MEPLKNVVQALRAKKSLGQHFLTDPHILKRIVESAGPLNNTTVIEVGPGPGGLTREILAHPYKDLFLIEQDERCLPHLEKLKEPGPGKLTILQGDALLLPLHTLGQAPRKIISNLPYNISVPLLLQWLEHIDAFENLTLMFQKEVAARLTASPNTPDYGRLSVMCQWRTQVTKLFDLPPGAFVPPPKVASTVVQIVPSTPYNAVSWRALEHVTKAAFSKRRKMLRSTLKGLLSASQLEHLQIDPTRRAESLSVQEFCTLAAYWEKECATASSP